MASSKAFPRPDRRKTKCQLLRSRRKKVTEKLTEVIERLKIQGLLPPELRLTRQLELSVDERLDERVPVPLVEGCVKLESETSLGEVSAPDMSSDELVNVVDV